MYPSTNVVMAVWEKGAKDAPKVLAILWTQVVAAQPQLLEVLIELHCSHYTEDRGNTPSELAAITRQTLPAWLEGYIVAH